jgi:hypothetical protein
MKTKYIVLTALTATLCQLAAVNNAFSYSVILPDTAPTPALPYAAEQDHYSGPASVQMALNSCPSVSARHFNEQDAVYTSILSHNAEPTLWFSDPTGLKGALGDAAFSPCGHWVDFSDTDKNVALGKTLFYIDSMRYLAPVSIGSSEHWVTIIGYQTDVKPSSPTASVTLENVLFYDPLPGNVSAMWVSGSAWLTEAAYWGVPMNKPGSAWNNKYIAVIEPPKSAPTFKVPKRVLRGRILPAEKIEASAEKWLKTVREKKLGQGPFEILNKETKIETPLLVKGEQYSYYLVPFKNARLAAIFNAYDGSFEELRYSVKQRKFVTDRKTIFENIKKTLRGQRVEVIETSVPELQYKPQETAESRFSPIYEVQATVKDAQGKERKLPLILNTEGQPAKQIKELERVSPK